MGQRVPMELREEARRATLDSLTTGVGARPVAGCQKAMAILPLPACGLALIAAAGQRIAQPVG